MRKSDIEIVCVRDVIRSVDGITPEEYERESLRVCERKKKVSARCSRHRVEARNNPRVKARIDPKIQKHDWLDGTTEWLDGRRGT